MFPGGYFLHVSKLRLVATVETDVPVLINWTFQQVSVPGQGKCSTWLEQRMPCDYMKLFILFPRTIVCNNSRTARCTAARVLFWVPYPIMSKTESTIAYHLSLMWKNFYCVSESVHNGAENHKRRVALNYSLNIGLARILRACRVQIHV